MWSALPALYLASLQILLATFLSKLTSNRYMIFFWCYWRLWHESMSTVLHEQQMLPWSSSKPSMAVSLWAASAGAPYHTASRLRPSFLLSKNKKGKCYGKKKVQILMWLCGLDILTINNTLAEVGGSFCELSTGVSREVWYVMVTTKFFLVLTGSRTFFCLFSFVFLFFFLLLEVMAKENLHLD